MSYIKRFAKLTFGLFLFSLGYYLAIQANIGLAPWSAFNVGVADKFNTTYGVVSIVTAIVIMGIDLLLGESIGWGTAFDAILVGVFVDWFTALELCPMMSNFWLGFVILIVSTEIIAVGSWFYMSAALGAGPRDTLMVALCKKLPKVPVGVIRGIIEGTALIVGWLFGAKVGVGTVISVFGMGIFVQFTFKLFRFDVRTVRNENIIETVRNIVKKGA